MRTERPQGLGQTPPHCIHESQQGSDTSTLPNFNTNRKTEQVSQNHFEAPKEITSSRKFKISLLFALSYLGRKICQLGRFIFRIRTSPPPLNIAPSLHAIHVSPPSSTNIPSDVGSITCIKPKDDETQDGKTITPNPDDQLSHPEKGGAIVHPSPTSPNKENVDKEISDAPPAMKVGDNETPSTERVSHDSIISEIPTPDPEPPTPREEMLETFLTIWGPKLEEGRAGLISALFDAMMRGGEITKWTCVGKNKYQLEYAEQVRGVLPGRTHKVAVFDKKIGITFQEKEGEQIVSLQGVHIETPIKNVTMKQISIRGPREGEEEEQCEVTIVISQYLGLTETRTIAASKALREWFLIWQPEWVFKY